MFQTNVEALQREGISTTEMQTILPTVHKSITETLAPKFMTLKPKNLVTQMMEDGYEQECKKISSTYKRALNFMLVVLEYVHEAV
jgi:hypothetical protein